MVFKKVFCLWILLFLYKKIFHILLKLQLWKFEQSVIIHGRCCWKFNFSSLLNRSHIKKLNFFVGSLKDYPMKSFQFFKKNLWVFMIFFYFLFLTIILEFIQWKKDFFLSLLRLLKWFSDKLWWAVNLLPLNELWFFFFVTTFWKSLQQGIIIILSIFL